MFRSTFSSVSRLVLPVAVALAATNVRAEGVDIRPFVEGGKVQTGGYIDGGTVQPQGPVSVFGYAFGESVADPYNLDDPGFNSDGPAGFADGTSLRFSFLPVTPGTFVQYWNGTGTPAFGALPSTPSPVALTIGSSISSFARLTQGGLTYTGTGGENSIFASAVVAGGIPDDHLLANIGFLDGSEDPVANAIPDGLYLLSAQLLNAGPGGALASDTVYILFANGVSEEVLDEAVDFVNAAYVPEPAALGLLASALPLVLRRRR